MPFATALRTLLTTPAIPSADRRTKSHVQEETIMFNHESIDRYSRYVFVAVAVLAATMMGLLVHASQAVQAVA